MNRTPLTPLEQILAEQLAARHRIPVSSATCQAACRWWYARSPGPGANSSERTDMTVADIAEIVDHITTAVIVIMLAWYIFKD